MPYRTNAFFLLAVLAKSTLTGCVDTQTPSDGVEQSKSNDNQRPTVTVDLAAIRATVSEHAYGMHTSVYNNALHDAELPERLSEAGITLLRYPGGGYSDNYHWSTHHMTHWFDEPNNRGYLAPKSDFGNFVSVLDSTATQAMITVNYGSNLTDDGPG